MKKLIVLLTAFLLVSLSGTQLLQAQSCPAPPPPFDKSSLVGEWSGSYTYEGQTYDLKVNIRLNGEKLAATTALPNLDIPSSEFMSWVCQSNELHMRLDLPENRAAKFIGRLQDGTLTGRFVFNEVPGVCTVSKDTFSLVKNSSSSVRME